MQWIGNWITTQQEKTSEANKERCILLKILASIYLLESFTWIPIQILYVHGHFKDITQYETTCIYDQTLIMSLGGLWSAPLHVLPGSAREHKMIEETSLGYCLVSF